MYRDPKGETIFEKTSTGLSKDPGSIVGESEACLRRKIKELEDEVKDMPGLRRRITELENEVGKFLANYSYQANTFFLWNDNFPQGHISALRLKNIIYLELRLF